MTIDEHAFETLADKTMHGIFDIIDNKLSDYLEVDFEEGIITIELDSGGQYVINKHAPNRQIWMSSPVSGASHFSYDAGSGGWVATRHGGTLSGMLAQELSQATGVAVSFD